MILIQLDNSFHLFTNDFPLVVSNNFNFMKLFSIISILLYFAILFKKINLRSQALMISFCHYGLIIIINV